MNRFTVVGSLRAVVLLAGLSPWVAYAHTQVTINSSPQLCAAPNQTKFGCNGWKLTPQACEAALTAGCASSATTHKNFYLTWKPWTPGQTMGTHACYTTTSAHTTNGEMYPSGGVGVLCLAPKYFLQQPTEDKKNLGNQCPNCGNPVNPSNGNKFQPESDYRANGPLPLSMDRYYNSMDRRATTMGGWRHSYDRTLRKDFGTLAMENSPDVSALYTTASSACQTGWPAIKGTVMGLAAATATYASNTCTLTEGTRVLATVPVYINNYMPPANPSLVAMHAERADGKSYNFTYSGGAYTPVAGVTATLETIASGYKLTDNDVVEEYDTNGVLLSIATRSGYTQTLSYSSGKLQSVTDSFGRTLTFGYTGTQLTSVTDADAKQYIYAYDVSGRLQKVTAPDGTFREYIYDDVRFAKALTGIKDESGTRFATYAYDAMGRATLTKHAGDAELVGLTYNADGTTNAQDALGAVRTYTFSLINGAYRATSISQPCVGCGTSSSSTTYDANGFVDFKYDFNGNQTDHDYNSRGQETQRIEAVGTAQQRTITTQWHTVFDKPVQIDEPGRRTVYTYDAATGDRLTQTVTDLSTSESSTATWTYTTFGRVATVDGPRTDVSDVTTYAYYTCASGGQCGQVHTITNALGHVTEITSYDTHGNPLTIVDANGVTTTLTYDLRQRLKTRAVAGATTSFDYDGVGQLDKVTLPDGSYLDYTYDAAHRLTDIEDNAGNKIHYTLDLMGNRTAEETLDPSAVLKRKQSQVFNILGRLKEIRNASDEVVVDYAYDAQGNRTTETAYDDSASFQTVNQFDALNRMWRTTAPDGGVTQYGYNARDQLVGVTDPKSLLTTYVMNALNFLLELVSPDTGVTGDEHDAAGNLTAKTDARGVRVEYSYDALNRLTFVDYDGTAEDVIYTYDSVGQTYGKGRLTGIQDAAGTLTLIYDAHGNLTQEQRVIGASTYTTSYAHDSADRVTSITYPSGRIVTYTRNSLGQVATVTTTVGGNTTTIAQSIAYMPFGGVKSYTLGNGVVVTRTYDTDYRLQNIADVGTSTVQHLNLNYDRRGNITLRDDLVATTAQNFAYDELSRLTSATGAYGTQGFTYDDVGNRLTQTGTTPDTYNYSGTSHQLTSLGSGAGFTYDDAGNVTVKDGLTLTYNEAHRSATVTLGGVTVGNTYGANGQRMTKSAGGVTTVFQYDRHGQLLAEQPDAGAPREYVWLDSIPLAQTSASGLAYFHVDQLNTPQKMSDESQAVVWQAAYEPFGAAAISASGGYENPLRFPGQYFDAETGLHQNWHRDYDPSIGRYLQSDPIGLLGGPSTYSYVYGNPMRFGDPTGLLVDAALDTATNTITFTDRDTGDSVTASAFSGGHVGYGGEIYQPMTAPEVPAPGGVYDIVNNPNPMPGRDDWYGLFMQDGRADDYYDDNGILRFNIRLHFGEVSHGCVTVNKRQDDADRKWRAIRKMLATTTTETIEYRMGPWLWSPAGRTTKYGTLTVK